MELTRTVEVGRGGHIDLVVPELEGQRVEIRIVPEAAPHHERRFGILKGRGRMRDDFDAPLDEFEPYS